MAIVNTGSTVSREVELQVKGRPTSDGAGVKLTRVLTGSLQQRLDPFLMLDEFRSDNPNDYVGGFPDHPHRGFETVTYLLAGRMRHRDNHGGEGMLDSGGVQWMTAGRGIIHSEMPEQKDGLLHGFQLWLNLPANAKMIAPWYRDISATEIPEHTISDGIAVWIIAGETDGHFGAMQRESTLPLILDVHMRAGSSFSQPLSATHNAFLYVYAGTITAGSMKTVVATQTLAVLSNAANADHVSISADEDSRLLLIAGNPLHEPIVQHGPFVMNSTQQIAEAIADYQAGRF